MFWPEQPNPLYTCSRAIGPFGLKSGLVSLNAVRAAPFLRNLRGTVTSGQRANADCSEAAARAHL
jgi:hypothetical protein